VPVYRGPFGPAQAERLLWRAGFGRRPGEARKLARMGLRAAVLSLTRPEPERLDGPSPTDERGNPLTPLDVDGVDHFWQDRMVRSNRQLVERMTGVWQDWFTTSNADVGSQRLMLDQNRLFRRQALGTFEKLLLCVTKDPAMLIWLSGNENTKDAPNENYARKLMELFTLGAGRPGGYTEHDVHEQARALTGWRNDFSHERGPHNFRFDPSLHDNGPKTIFGKTGTFDWKDSCWLCVQHANHASFFVRKLWSYFVPTAPPDPTEEALERLYVSRGHAVRPVLEAILMHPQLYLGPPIRRRTAAHQRAGRSR
jgi:uncharacterized protein (DUF1800 family)